jgi:hypothetical protein
MQNTQHLHRVRRPRRRTIIRVSPKSTYAMRVMLWCGVLAVLLLTYSFGRYQAAVEADASVKEARR